jgi:hypothetical protein
MTFDPKEHLIKLPRKVKDKAIGQYTTVYDDYLEVKWRLVVFREKYPHGHLDTEFLRLDWEQGIAICKCIVNDGEGGYAHGTGTETRKGFEDFVERAETRAIGRALAALGFGTQFVGEELSEGDHVCDAPVTTTVNTPASNGHTPAPDPDASLEHPTEGHLAALRNLALTECGEEVEVYEDRLRTMMKIPKQASVSPRLLTKTMTMTVYMEVFAYYRRLEEQLAKGKETPGTPTPDADAAEQERIVREAMDAGIPEQEARHIVAHHDLKAAHSLLVAAAKKRRQAA